ncbi:unnamed protein product [Spirodela intermedia]|uniref:Uncharacterized protein n=2 Tax=Spirodela intermedia TaxID=51605 RepID=A0A7I8IK99_SPIIN|nr:unnamed protein product [Spirodela intermedia]CAA6658309.1 unnamed protein product [Spirodela intermedia]CAA7394505.1 unnamed protein product [Spirodela intermedia]
MAFVLCQKGPDVVGSFGWLQPLGNCLKLIIEEPISLSSSDFSLLEWPVSTFMLSLVAQGFAPFNYDMILSNPTIGLVYLFAAYFYLSNYYIRSVYYIIIIMIVIIMSP